MSMLPNRHLLSIQTASFYCSTYPSFVSQICTFMMDTMYQDPIVLFHWLYVTMWPFHLMFISLLLYQYMCTFVYNYVACVIEIWFQSMRISPAFDENTVAIIYTINTIFSQSILQGKLFLTTGLRAACCITGTDVRGRIIAVAASIRWERWVALSGTRSVATTTCATAATPRCPCCPGAVNWQSKQTAFHNSGCILVNENNHAD